MQSSKGSMETNRVLTALKGESSFGMLKQDDVKALPSKLLRNLGVSSMNIIFS